MLFTLYPRFPYELNIIAGPVLSYLSASMNIFVIFALCDRKLRSPATIIMEVLAVADGLTALCTYGLEPYFNLFYKTIDVPGSRDTAVYYSFEQESDLEISISEAKQLVDLKYPLCAVHYFLQLFADNFHVVSILLTASLGMQKLIVIVWPFWSRANLTNRKTAVVCAICFLFSMVMNIPKMFVVSLTSDEDGSCIVSQPQKMIEYYVLTIYPILFAIVLISAVVVMLVSTCFILIILCRRKHIRGHTTLSKYEKKSCLLVVIVMIVFLLSEVPRIYLNTIIFDTYRSDSNQENIASYKVYTEIQNTMTVCFENLENKYVSELNINREMSTCARVSTDPEIQESVLEWVDYFTEDVSVHMSLIKRELKGKLKSDYIDLIWTLSQTVDSQLDFGFRLQFHNFVSTLYCNNVTEDDVFDTIIDLESIYKNSCDEPIVLAMYNRLTFLILGSTPYSEPMNYILNIIWGHVDISLEDLKLFTEILKISMIVGCGSNFVIYIVMSEKLREAISKKFTCCKQ